MKTIYTDNEAEQLKDDFEDKTGWTSSTPDFIKTKIVRMTMPVKKNKEKVWYAFLSQRVCKISGELVVKRQVFIFTPATLWNMSQILGTMASQDESQLATEALEQLGGIIEELK